MVKQYLKLSIFFLIVTSAALSAQNQEEQAPFSLWVNGGLGFSSVGSLGINGGINLLSNDMLYTFRGSYQGESIKFLSKEKSYYDYGFLVGYAYSGSEWNASLSTGLSAVAGFKWVNNGDANCFIFCQKRVGIPPVFGIPIEIQLYRKIEIGGIGLTLVGNYNRLEPFVGLNFNVSINVLNLIEF